MPTSARSCRARRIGAVALVVTAVLAPVSTTTTAEAVYQSDACGVKLAKAGGGTWTCSFVDNFGGGSLNTRKWNVMDTATYGFHLGDTCFIKGQGLSVSDGLLTLKVRRTAPFTCRTPWGSLQSRHVGAGIASARKFSQTYGRFEVRMKVPVATGPGLTGGYWLNPQDNRYGAWPASGEIDVAEWMSRWANHMYPSLHYNGSTRADTAFNCRAGQAGRFHRYAVVWSRTRMNFFYDGALCFSRAWQPTGMVSPAPFDQAFYHALTWAAVSGVDPATDTTTYPAKLSVDWVKTWY